MRYQSFVSGACGLLLAPIMAHTAEPGAKIEEVVVTALKRETSVLDAPAAITALDGEALREQQVTTLADVSQRVPSVTVGEDTGLVKVSVRGVSLTPNVGGIEAPIAVHYDGVYLSASIPADFLMMDAGSVEVLRGPQGTLYGRNATGGALNFVPARPTDEFSGFVNATYGNYETSRLEGAISGPLSDDVSARLYVLRGEQGEGWMRNVVTGNDLGASRTDGARGVLRFEPNERFSISLSGFHYERTSNAALPSVPTSPFSAEVIANNPDYVNHTVSMNPRRPALDSEGSDLQRDSGGLLTVSWELTDDIALTSNTSYTDLFYRADDADCDVTATPTCVGVNLDGSKAWQEELNLSGKALKGRIEWLLGYYFGRERQFWQRDYVFENPAQGYVAIGDTFLPNGTFTTNGRSQTTEASAAFAEVTMHLNDQWSVYGGGRWSEDRRDLATTGSFDIPGFGALTQCDTATVHSKVKFSDTTFKLGTQYRFSSSSQVYVQWQQGFKAGGVNPASCGDDIFEPEQVDAYEVGYKAEYLSGMLQLNVAAFHYDYKNMQVYQLVGITADITNAAEATIDGVEIETKFRPSRDLTFDLAASYIPKADYGSYFNTDPLDEPAGAQDLNGRRLPYAPESTVNFGVEYTLRAGNLADVTVRGEMYHFGGAYLRPYNLPLDRQEKYTIGNLVATLKPLDSNWTIKTWVRNLTDRDYVSSGNDLSLMGNMIAAYGMPRTYGVGVNYNW